MSKLLHVSSGNCVGGSLPQSTLYYQHYNNNNHSSNGNNSSSHYQPEQRQSVQYSSSYPTSNTNNGYYSSNNNQCVVNSKSTNNSSNNLSSSVQSSMMISSCPSMPQTKGLLNMPGQNNCFLNSAVQVLWHLDIFRRSFRELTGHACMGHQSCIFCALKELFTQFQYSQETALPPDALRRALAETFSDQRRFQLGFMDDAAECFENMLLRVHSHIAHLEPEDHCSAPHCITHKKFAMNLVEQLSCSACGATSEPLPFTQMVHYVSTPALCHQAKKLFEDITYNNNSHPSFGALLKAAGALGDFRDCPKSCGARVQIKKTLYNKPDIVSIGLVWDSERPSINHISDVFQLIGTSLRFQDIFDYQYTATTKASAVDQSTSTSNGILQLVGIVTYYGKHYSTFFYHTKLETWIYFDDATVREIGHHWEQVVEKCIRGHFQPLLLLYANPHGCPVDTSKAPQTITMIPNPNKTTAAMHAFHHLKNPPKMNCSTSGQSSHTRGYSNGQLMGHQRSQYLHQQPQHQQYQQQQQMFNTRGYINRPPRQGSVDDLLNSYTSASEDVPDSPLTKSSTSSAYFSDIGEVESNSYISRRTIENILSFQRSQHQHVTNGQHQQHSHIRQMAAAGSGGQQRSSTSSTESFDQMTVEKARKVLEEKQREKMCSLQRRDSGNSSNSGGGSGGGGCNGSAGGDRTSSSSSSGCSSVSSEHQSSYFNGFTSTIKRQLSHLPALRNLPGHQKERLTSSDYGYDSFSLSSSDSYPASSSAGGGGGGPPPSPNKHNQFSHSGSQRLSQIPEDFMELRNNCSTDCDKLCAEADLLLLRSHEKEREGDIRVAAILSDSAAQKARSAMDAPYSNPQMLITAKMKHSMCVMRSASLHRRVKDAEAEEKRRLKAESLEILHSRQNSRDSLRGRHSRQNSKDGKEQDPNSSCPPSSGNNSCGSGGGGVSVGEVAKSLSSVKTLELYGTLPRKSAKKKLAAMLAAADSLPVGTSSSIISSSASSSLRIKDDRRNSIPSILDSTVSKSSKKQDKFEDSSKSDIESICSSSTRRSSSTRSVHHQHQQRESADFSDYYSEYEVRPKASGSTKCNSQVTLSKIPVVRRSSSGASSCRENDSETYGDLDNVQATIGKKQHRIRRKLLLGSFMKRKNRSLPDLRESSNQDDFMMSVKDSVTGVLSKDDHSVTNASSTTINSPTSKTVVAQVSRRGFHKVHALCDKGLTPKMSLVKVNIPQVDIKSGHQEQKKGTIASVHNSTRLPSIPPSSSAATQSSSPSSSSVTTSVTATMTTQSGQKSATPPAKPVRLSSCQKTNDLHSSSSSNHHNTKSNTASTTTATPSPPPPPPADILAPDHHHHHHLHHHKMTTSNSSVVQGIEPNEELPPPPDDFLVELREKRKQMVDCSLMNQLLYQTRSGQEVTVGSNNHNTLNCDQSLEPFSSHSRESNSRSTGSANLTSSSSTTTKVDIAGGADEVDSVSVAGKQRKSDGVNSVRNLASKFEQLAAAKPTSNLINNANNNVISLTDLQQLQLQLQLQPVPQQQQQQQQQQLPQSQPAAAASPASFSNLANLRSSSSQPTLRPPSNASMRSNSSTTSGLRVSALLSASSHFGQSNSSADQPLASPLPPQPPASPSPSVSSGIHSSRPQRPPDYQTAMKRLGLRKVEMTSVLQQNRLSNGSLNGYKVSGLTGNNNVSAPSLNLNSNQSPNPSLVMNGSLHVPPCNSNSNSNQSNCNSSATQGSVQFNGPTVDIQLPGRLRKKSGNKKSVSFSDDVILVASAEAEEEEHFPNPLLERVLAKTNILQMGQSTNTQETNCANS